MSPTSQVINLPLDLRAYILNVYFISLANAFTASAAIFDAVSEVDSKFSKLADKECDGLSAEVKKWFKRLAVRVPNILSMLTVILTPDATTERGARP